MGLMKIPVKGLVICLLIVLGLALRLYGLGQPQVSLDESYTLYYAKTSLLHILALEDPNPPLYLLLAHPLALTGNIYLVRLMSVIFGVLAIPLMYLIGKRLFDTRAGLYAAAILTFSPFLVLYSQEARSYALFTFLVMLSMYFYICYLDNKRFWPAYLLSTIAMLYSHFFAALVVIAQNAFVLVKKEKPARWYLVQLLAFIAYIPGLLLIYRQFSRVSNDFWIRREFLVDILNLPYIFSGGALCLLFLPLFIYGIVNLYRWEKKARKTATFLLSWTLLPMIISLLYSLLVSPIVVPKYLIYTSIPFYLAISYALTRIDRRFASAILLGIVLISSYSLIGQAGSTDKESWKNVSDYTKGIVKNIGATDAIIILDPGYNLHAFAYYYLPECFDNNDIYGCAANNSIFTLWGEEYEKGFIRGANNILYVRKDGNTYPTGKDAYLAYMETQFAVHSKKDFPLSKYDHMTVYWLKDG
jgi:mannosyltransferase